MSIENSIEAIYEANKRAGKELHMEVGPRHEPMLIQMAMQIKEDAYAPYSNVKVGALVVALNNHGQVGHFAACNFEPSNTIREHAEKMAARLAYMKGYRVIESVYVTSRTFVEHNAMCPECRDYYRKLDREMNVKIVVVNPDGSIKIRTTLKEMLPNWSEV